MAGVDRQGLFDTDGNVIEYQSVGRDITDLYESNALFRDMLDKTVVGVYIVNRENIIRTNSALSEIFGYTENELEGMPIENLIHPKDRPFVMEQLEERLSGIVIDKPYQFRGLRQDGTKVWLEVIGKKTRYKGRDTIIGTVQDITERRANLLALQESQANLSTILENTRTIYILVDREFNLLSYNKAAMDYANEEFGEQEGREFNLNSFIRPKRISSFGELMERATQGEKVNYTIEDQGMKKRWFDININPVRSQDKVVAFVISAEDITLEKKSKEELERQLELFQELSFITSHELRHEYAKLHGLVDLITSDDGQNGFVRELLNECQTTFKRLNESIYKLNNRINFSQSIHLGDVKRIKDVDRIVLLDDDPMMNTIHQKLLEEKVDAQNIVDFTTVDDAIEFLSAHSDDRNFVLLDINMPGKDGWDFLRECEERKLDIPVVILSSSIDSQDRYKARGYREVMEFISKPLTKDLVNQVMELVELKQTSQ